MEKADFLKLIHEGKEVAFGAAQPSLARALDASWISEAVAAGEERISISNAVIAGVIKIAPSDVASEIRISSCTFESLDAGGCAFAQMLAITDCIVTGFLSFTGSRFVRGLIVRGTAVQDVCHAIFCTIDVQFNAGSFKAKSLILNGSRVQGNCVISSAQVGELRAQKVDIAGYLDTSNIRVTSVLDIIGLKCSNWIGPNMTICGEVIAENVSIDAGASLQSMSVMRDVNFSNASLAGILDMAGAKFSGGVNLSGSHSGILRLAGATFHGPVTAAYATCTAIESIDAAFGGPVLFHDSRVIGNVLLAGAEFSDVLSFDRSTIGGSCELREGANRERVVCKGQVRFAGCKIGAQLIANKAEFGSDLIVVSAQIAADIVLVDALVRGSLLADGAKIKGALKGERFSVAGELVLSRAVVEGGVMLDNADIKGGLDGTTSRILTAFALRSARVGSSLRLIHCRVSGPLHLQSSAIGDEINLTQASIDEIVLQSAFAKDRSADAVLSKSMLFAGTSYNRIRVGWNWLAKTLAAGSIANEDALYNLERHLRKTGRITESERVYLYRRRAEAHHAPFMRKCGMHVLDVLSSYGVARGRIILLTAMVVGAACVLSVVVPHFVMPDGTKCTQAVSVEAQEAVVTALQSFAPINTQKGVSISQCPILNSPVKASTVVVFLQVIAAMLLPVLLGTLTGWFRTQAASEPERMNS